MEDIEILEPGNVPVDWRYGTCEKCGCKIRCAASAAYSETNVYYAANRDNANYFDLDCDGFAVKCPMENCGNTITMGM